MDASVFVLKREEIQQRMEARRLEAVTAHEASPTRLLPWVLTTGVGLVSGLKSSRKSYGWLGSLAGALLFPTVLKLMGHKNGQPEGFWHRIIKAAFPSLRI